MNVLSLFDGVSCGRIALERTGIEVNNYYSSEIDKYAIKVADKNYPQDSDKRLGDVTKWQDWNIDWSNIDLVTGGFPCQAWSVAGTQQGDKDERGMLFWTMLDIMKKVLEHNPGAKFLIENVKMKKEFEEYITLHTTQALGTVYKHLIDSALVSAQNRQRFYWTNIEGIKQPEDKGILLRDILDFTVNNVLSQAEYDYMCRSESTTKDVPRLNRAKGVDEKANTLTRSLHKGVPHGVIKYRPCELREYKQDGLYYRKLTPLECERLQTLPDNYTEGVSNTQRYKMIGNGWTVDVVAHIFKGIN